MERKLADDLTVNDGKGLMDNLGMIDSLIVDCNNIVRLLTGGEYIGFCAKAVEMVQKLAKLKQGVKDDTDFLKDRVAQLTKENEDLCNQLFERKGDESV